MSRGGAAANPTPLASAATDPAARELTGIAERIAKSGGTPLAVARDGRLLGVVHLKDIVRAVPASALANCGAWASAP